MDLVKAIHCTSDHIAFYLCDNEYYTIDLKHKITHTSTGFSEAQSYSKISKLASKSKLKGFQPSLSQNTFFLLKGSCVLPVKFVGNKIQLD